MQKINVAIFPCGSEVGLEINRALKYARHFEIWGLNSVNDHGRIAFDNYIGSIPFIKNRGIIEVLKRIIKEKEIRFLIPTMDGVAAFLKENEKELECEVVCADQKTIRLLTSKTQTYSRLKDIVLVPDVYKDYNEIKNNLPVFTKPDIGYGSRGIELIETLEQFEKKWYNREGLIFCENLPGKEYTIDCFSNSNHEILFAGARERKRIRMGISVNTCPVKLVDIKSTAQKIGKELQLKGLWFFQVKEATNGNLKLLEVASRVSGSMALYRLKGVNFIMLELFRRMGFPITIQENELENLELERAFNCKMKVDLFYNSVYVDFDDCLYLNDKTNPELIHFLYDQINLGKKIILITKHKGNLELKLKELRLNNLFDEIIHLNENEHKYKYIKEKSSIFIDDSYSERQEIIQQLGIPAFAPDVIPALIK